jgi:hypothetical protein
MAEFIIVLDRGTSEEREAIHALVKEHARGWWHRYTDLWIVVGLASTPEWRDVLKPAITRGSESSVMVFQLPESGIRWAYFGPHSMEKTAWLHREL